MGLPDILEMARNMIASVAREGCAAVDGTVGRGKDTVFLAQCVGQSGRVFGFDIQKVALDSARERLASYDLLNRVQLVQAGHESIEDTIRPMLDRPLRAAMFNMGYLPGFDHTVVTRAHTSIRAMEDVLGLLEAGGMLTAVLYAGHPGGREEKEAVTEWCSSLPSEQFLVMRYEVLNRSGAPPALIVIEKVARTLH